MIHIYDPDTGHKISAFDVSELCAMDIPVEEAMHIVLGYPLDGEPVKLRSVDGFRVEFA